MSENLDYHFNSINKSLEQTILDIGEVDSIGQVFCYLVDKNLVDESSINCLTLKVKFKELEKNLNSLDGLTKYLIKEYNLGTFTSKLSHAHIFNMAKELPKFEDWSANLNKLELNFKKVFCFSISGINFL